MPHTSLAPSTLRARRAASIAFSVCMVTLAMAFSAFVSGATFGDAGANAFYISGAALAGVAAISAVVWWILRSRADQ